MGGSCPGPAGVRDPGLTPAQGQAGSKAGVRRGHDLDPKCSKVHARMHFEAFWTPKISPNASKRMRACTFEHLELPNTY